MTISSGDTNARGLIETARDDLMYAKALIYCWSLAPFKGSFAENNAAHAIVSHCGGHSGTLCSSKSCVNLLDVQDDMLRIARYIHYAQSSGQSRVFSSKYYKAMDRAIPITAQ